MRMANSGDVLRQFYQAVVQRDFAKARTYLHDDLLFVGLFETYPNADSYIATLTGLMSITTRLDVRAVIAEGDDVAVFFELETKAPAEAVTLVAEWHKVKDGKIYHSESAFDGRPFAAMFAGK
jgi:predicted SnoaL-like aldol condensation-catalyzing enzyme